MCSTAAHCGGVSGGAWSVPQTLGVRAGADAWYPTVEWVPGNSLAFSWSSRSDDRASIETAQVTPVYAGFTGSPLSGVAPVTVSFTNASTGDYTESWWDLGDGWTSTMDSPSHIYSVGGVYTVTLTVSGPGGTDTLTRTDYVTIYAPVEADFTATPTSGVAPLEVSFANASIGDYSQSRWDFGDGVTSTLQSPPHTYTETGVYTVTITASGPEGTDTEIKREYITAWHGVYLPLVLKLR